MAKRFGAEGVKRGLKRNPGLDQFGFLGVVEASAPAATGNGIRCTVWSAVRTRMLFSLPAIMRAKRTGEANEMRLICPKA